MAVTGGFTVNTSSREEVRSFYNAVYSASEGVPMNSSANVASCFAGTNALDFMDAVLRRINWYRAMAGIPASVMLNNMFNTNDQAAALIMSANGALSHTPPSSWTCWTSYGSNAANNSNIAIGYAGADAVNGYMRDNGGNNFAVGHRRWLLYPQTQLMGTGDIPRQGPYFSANAIWVFDGHQNDPRPATRTPFVAWPPAGYVPYQLAFARGSFGYLKGTASDFSNATVTMRSNGVPVSVVKETLQNGYGENTLIWVPMGLDSSSQTANWPFSGTDTVYQIGISNVLVGGTPTNFNYTVTLFDPAVPGADYFPPTISGPSQPVVGLSNTYTFNAISNATSYQWRYTRKGPFSLTDGAEAGLGNWTTNTSAGYSVIVSSPHPVASGTRAFHLCHTNPSPQLLTLNTTLYPRTNTTLQFKTRLGWATVDQSARVQVSTNGGSAWINIFSKPGTGGSGETSYSTTNISLAPFAGVLTQLRFNYDVSGSYFPQTDPGVGWYVDDIIITNCDQLLSAVTNTTATTSFQFNPPQAGDYYLDVRALIFTDFPLDWGPTKAVTATTNAPLAIRITSTTYSNNQVRIDFTLQSGSASTFKLLYANQVPGSWSTDAVAVLTTLVPGSSYRFTTTPGGTMRYYRIQSP